MSSKSRFPRSARRKLHGWSLIVAFILFVGSASRTVADIKVPGLFSDNMLLQQNARVPVWGWVDEGEEVTVSFRNSKATAITREGKWRVMLGNLKAGGPDQLAESGKNTITLTNVMVGDVWVCSGQSNMEMSLSSSFESQADISTSANTMLRLFTVPSRFGAAFRS